MFDVRSMFIIYKSTAFRPTVESPIKYILDWVVPGHFEDTLGSVWISSVAPLSKCYQNYNPWGRYQVTWASTLPVKYNLYRRRRDTAASILTYGKMCYPSRTPCCFSILLETNVVHIFSQKAIAPFEYRYPSSHTPSHR